MLFKDAPFRTRRVLLLYKVYGDSALLVLNWTSLSSINALLALSQYCWLFFQGFRLKVRQVNQFVTSSNSIMIYKYKFLPIINHLNQYEKVGQSNFTMIYSLNKKEWICLLFKEWIVEKSEIRVNLEWTFVLFTHFGVTSGITRNPWVIPVVTPKWVNNTNVHSKFTPNSL